MDEIETVGCVTGGSDRAWRRTLLAAAAVAATFAAAPRARAATPGDPEVLNLLLNLAYLSGQFHSVASSGTGLDAALLSGVGMQGPAAGGRQAAFADPLAAQLAREMAVDLAAHVRALREILGAAAVAQPRIDLAGGGTGAFSAMARAAGGALLAGGLDPYAGDEPFLLASFFLRDLGVTAYRAAAGRVRDPASIEVVSGFLATGAVHAAAVRALLSEREATLPELAKATEAIAALRAGLGRTNGGEQGVTSQTARSPAAQDVAVTNILPLGNGVVGREPPQVLNVLYLTRQAVSRGGFLPDGANGFYVTASAS